MNYHPPGYDEAGFAAGCTQAAALDLPGFHAEIEALLDALRADPERPRSRRTRRGS